MNKTKKLELLAALLLGLVLCCIFIIYSLQNSEDKVQTYIHQLTNQSHSQIESYVITTSTGLCFVVDGGTEADKDYLIDYIKENDDDATVNGWFLTHYHKDHTEALAAYLESGDDSIKIEHIYYDFPDLEEVAEYNDNRYDEYVRIQTQLDQSSNVTRVEAGYKLDFRGLHILVVNDFQTFENNYGNNTSVCYQFSNPNTEFLVLGDCGEELADYLIANKYDLIANNDFLQMAHHGQRGGSKELYHVIAPKVCLWPITDWIYTNDDGKADLKFDETIEWLSDIERIDIFAKDGTQQVELKIEEKEEEK